MHKVEMAFNKGYRVGRDGILYGIRYGIRGRAMSAELDSRGYQRFTFYIGEKRKRVHVHRLQAYQKFGQDVFQEGIQVRHLNGNKLDNSWGNIAIGTNSENQMDIPADIRHARAVKRGRAYSILTVEDVLEMRRLRKEERWTYAKLMVRFGVAKSTVAKIIRRETWCDI